jgi:membrane glycosyltransferase
MECELKALAREKAVRSVVEKHAGELEVYYKRYLQQLKRKGTDDAIHSKKR